MKFLTSALLLFSLFFSANAHENDKAKVDEKILSGKVMKESGEQVAAAKIIIKETNESFYADLDGNFQIKLKTDKVYTLSINSIGYAPVEVKSNELGLISEISLPEL